MFFERFPAFFPLMIPILALLIPIVAIVTHYLGKANSERLRHETIRELVKAGQPIPPELMADAPDSDWGQRKRDPGNPNRMLLPALINIGLGFGLMGMFYAMSFTSWLWAVGLVPLFLGLGFLTYWLVERKGANAQLTPLP